AFACLMARDSGLPIGEVVLACTGNRVIPVFLATGAFRPRASIATLANTMDVGAPSNLERLRHLFDQPANMVQADWVDDNTIQQTIRATFEHTGAIVCPHTACGLAVRDRRRQRIADTRAHGEWLVAATAHPA